MQPAAACKEGCLRLHAGMYLLSVEGKESLKVYPVVIEGFLGLGILVRNDINLSVAVVAKKGGHNLGISLLYSACHPQECVLGGTNGVSDGSGYGPGGEVALEAFFCNLCIDGVDGGLKAAYEVRG